MMKAPQHTLPGATARSITDPEAALAFILAGKAVFTARSERTWEHLTFSIRNWKKAKHGTMHFVGVRTGNDFANIGVVLNRNSFTRGKRADLPWDDPRVRGFRYVFEHLCQRRMPPRCEVWHEGQCGRCGRALTDPESIERGIGPECIKKVGGLNGA